MVESQQLATRIIEEQELVIGPLAWREAKKVSGLKIDASHRVQVEGDARATLTGLVRQYEGLFGPASVAVCRDAVRTMLSRASETDVPDVLK